MVPIADEYVRTSPCLSPFYHFYVEFNGNVMPCCNLRSEIARHKYAIITGLNTSSDIFLIYAGERLAGNGESASSDLADRRDCAVHADSACLRIIKISQAPIHYFSFMPLIVQSMLQVTRVQIKRSD